MNSLEKEAREILLRHYVTGGYWGMNEDQALAEIVALARQWAEYVIGEDTDTVVGGPGMFESENDVDYFHYGQVELRYAQRKFNRDAATAALSPQPQPRTAEAPDANPKSKEEQ